MADAVAEVWDVSATTVVIGFGAAGACAALEAAAGGSVLVLDRFLGGGATKLSGGVVYAGGGTEAQRAAGVSDDPEAMFDYLRHEVADAVSEPTLRRFCEGSVADLEWLAGHGVPFAGSLCPDKTSYPTNRHYLYYSGSESSGWGRRLARPAARGHRVVGRGTSGRVLYQRLAEAVARRGIGVLAQTTARELVLDPAGRVTGVRCTTMTTAPPAVRGLHRWLARAGAKPFLYAPALGRALFRQADRLERRYAKELLVRAERGVVISAGGFIADRALVHEHAPAYRGGLPLGTPGDDGAGLRLGLAAGGVADRLDRLSAWRFVSPPTALISGLLVDRAGRRICDESRYGAAVGEAIITRSEGAAWLLLDAGLIRTALRQLRRQTLWFQRVQALYLLTVARVSAPTLAQVAERAGVDPVGLRATVQAHLDALQEGKDDPMGKPAELVRAIERPPYSLIDVSVRPRMGYPCPMLTLGGLVVDEDTGQVRNAIGSSIPGLYAAGRSAVGLCSTSYVSGLSLADCVFSGRRAGRHVVATDLAEQG
ncbi:MAG TPA: FAD-binding protein [Kineosporiaceae bacterium]|nr:FAD-binding protein [Kineosporiaceae bacterium]